MANEEQLTILRQGVEVWNEWRKEHPDPYFSPDLTNAFLDDTFLGEVNLYRANLNRARLRQANLTGAILASAVFMGADLRETTLNNTRLTGAGLSRANLRGAKLVGADLRRANLMEAILHGVDLRGANLNGASLIGTNLTDAILDNVNLSKAELGDTIFGNVNLCKVDGLENVWHRFSSIISSKTMQLCQGNLPIQFMRGCGLTDWEIASAKLYNPDLENDEINQTLYEVYDMRAEQALQISPLFISYSHADSIFVDKLSICLNDKGIRYWRDVLHARAGRLEKQIDRAMRLNPIVLLVLSEYSLRWALPKKVDRQLRQVAVITPLELIRG